MVLFHILDAITQDEQEKEKTEEVRVVSYESDGTVVTDDEYEPTAERHSSYRSSSNMEKHAMVIHLFGADETGAPIRANVYGFRPYFYVELPANDSTQKRLFKSKLKDALKRKGIPESIVGVEWVSMKKLYGYTGGREFPFAKVSVPSIVAFRAIKRIFLETEFNQPIFKLTQSGEPLKVYDSNLDPMLRFFHLRDIAPCGWVSLDAEPDEDGHLDCQWEEVNPVAAPPMPSAPFLLAIWDIECYSASGDFPVAERGDPIIQIGVVLVRGGKVEGKHIFVRGTCDEIPGATVHSSPTEKGVLESWAKAMMEWNPDILIGYNIFGFDERYLWKRAEKLGISGDDALQSLSRLADCGKEVKLEEKRLSSSALGDNYLYTWSSHGRVQIDLYHYVKRGYNLPSYKLDSVCQHFMSGKLSGVDVSSEPGKWVLRTKTTGDVIPGRYVVLLDETGDVAVEKLKVVEIRPGSAVVVEAPSGDDAEDIARETADAVKWAVVKDDVSPADIFRLDRGSSADRARVAAYCIQDCDLTYELYKKLDVFNNAMAMANTCPVPIPYIFTRGQGIKIESLIFKECLASRQAIETLANPNRGATLESYEGAIVLDPQPGFYFDAPVGVADFASLYPSTIESENISHDSLLWVEDRDTNGKFLKYSFGSKEAEAYLGKGVGITEIEFDIWGNHPEDDAKKHPRKIVVGRRKCAYAKLPGDLKGTLPTIVQKLLAARKRKRKEAEKETDPFRKALLDAEQLAYKLTANSLYGQLGSSTFKIRLQHLAASVTAYGRKQILFAKRVIERFYGPEAGDPRCTAEAAQIVYGDSVSGDTPLYLQAPSGKAYIQRIDELTSAWLPWHDTKEAADVSGIRIWTDKGWTTLRRVIRHRLVPGKKMYRILTHTGVVDCTEDHSLVGPGGEALKPCDVGVGSRLLHNDSVAGEYGGKESCEISAKEAWAMGFFLADGSADVYDCPSGMKATWAINKADKALLEEAARKLPFETKILDTVESSHVYKLVAVGDIKKQALRYRALFYNAAREKRIPEEILNGPLEIVREFLAGFYAGDGDKANGFGYKRWDQKGKEVCAGLYILSRRLGFTVSLNDRTGKESVFRMTLTEGSFRKPADTIKKMRELPTESIQYVYDIETENHHFSVGPGALVVHNTDSLFVCFNPRDPATGAKLEGVEAIKATMELTEEAGKRVTKYLAPPHDFEYDKVFYPFIIFSKKRYVGNKYEEDPEHYSQTSMGIVTKRRDNAPLVKTIYGGAIRKLLNERDIPGAAAFVKEKTMELVEGRMSLNQLTISKSLRAEYKTATPPAHKMLAERIKARDPGNAPASGDRIPYVYISAPIGQEASKLQGDRIEHPSYVKEKGLKLDARYYIEHQLMNPLAQLFSLCLEQMPGFQGAVDAAMRETAASRILFDAALEACNRESRKQLAAKFGMTVVAPPRTTGGRVAAVAAPPVPVPQVAPTMKRKQGTLDSFILDSMLVEAMKSSKKKAAAAATVATTEETAPVTASAPKKKSAAAPAAKKKKKSIELNV